MEKVLAIVGVFVVMITGTFAQVTPDGLQKKKVVDNTALWAGFADCKPAMNVRGTDVRMTGVANCGLIPGQSGQFSSVKVVAYTMTIGAGSDIRIVAIWSEGGDNDIPSPYAGVMYDCSKWSHGTELTYSVEAAYQLTRPNGTSITEYSEHFD